MESSKHVSSHFERILNQQSVKKPSILYNNVKNTNKKDYKPQDVIQSVYSQVTAFQKADSLLEGKSAYKNLSNANKSYFLPVNKLPVYADTAQQESKSNPAKYESQCYLDTQMLNVIDEAEIINSNSGMTQEFDTTFAIDETCLNADIHNSKDAKISLIITTNRIEENKIASKKCLQGQSNNFSTQLDISSINEIKEMSVMTESNLTSETAAENTITFNQDNLSDGDDAFVTTVQNQNNFDTMLDKSTEYINSKPNSQKSQSPIINLKYSNRNQRTPSPLVVSLQTFENFENFTMSLIEETDFETAMCLIKSKMVEKNMPLTDDGDIIARESPILQYKSDNLHISSMLLMPSTSRNKHDIEDVIEKSSDILKDEILFSSDEEADNDLADKFVCNKILGSTSSSPPNYLTCDDKEIDETSLIKLVEKFDQSDSLNLSQDKVKSKSLPNSLQVPESYDNHVIKIKDRCMTDVTSQSVSNKQICNADKALPIYESVFENDDLNDTENDETCMRQLQKNKKSDYKELVDSKINDDILLKEFENIDMSLEAGSADNNDEISKGLSTENNNTEKSIIDSNKKSLNMTTFVGFKTANNKDIKISQDAYTKTKDVFKDLGNVKKKEKNHDYMTSYSSTSKSVVGFKTASNKVIKISDLALSEAENIFNHADEVQNLLNSSNVIATDKPGEFIGFKTASNKDITISDASVSKTKDIFKDLDVQNNLCANNTFYPSIKKAVAIDEGERKCSTEYTITNEKSKNNTIMSNQLVNNDFTQTPEHRSHYTGENLFVKCEFDEIEPIFRGFETPFENFDQTLNKSDEGKESVNNNNIFAEKSIVGFKRFKSPSFKETRLLQEISQDTDKSPIPNNNDYCYDEIIDEFPPFRGFETASKKPVIISAEAIARSKRIFQDIDENRDTVSEMIPKSNQVHGFKSCNKFPIQTSEHKQDSRSNNPIKKVLAGFKTASNIDVKISKKALAHCKKIFDGEDLDIETDIIPDMSRNTGFSGFHTANNNKVSVSNTVLQLFSDELVNRDTANHDTEEIPSNKNLKSMLNEKFGFQTGRNKECKVSEEALLNSKKKFEETSLHKLKSSKKRNFNNELTKESTVENPKQNDYNIESILDTQVMNNFHDNLCTEDFRDTPKPAKRSGSPILSCPKAKQRKKFETPYKLQSKSVGFDKKEVINRPTNLITFDDDYKKVKKYTLNYLKEFETDGKGYIDPYILTFSLENMLDFEFMNERNDLGEGKITLNHVKMRFMEATDKKIIPDGWLNIQLKLIIWKLLSYEVKFPKILGKICTVRNVFNQLKYRYDKELYNAERPILRKILEKDDVPSRTIVLCVAGIFADGVSVISATSLTNIELLLTDGWYFIKATIDNMITSLVSKGKITVGSKIVTCGAELLNCEQGISPWEDMSSVRLSISGNSTRLAPWDAKLGLRPGLVPSRLKAVQVDGGRVSLLRVKVTKVYPRLYVEKFPDGSTVTRSERLELQHQTKYEAEIEGMVEKIYEEVGKEMCEQEPSQDSETMSDPTNKRKCYETGTQIAKLMKHSKDPAEFRAQLTSSQIHRLQDHLLRQRDKHLEAIQKKVAERIQSRNVVQLVRGRIVDVQKDGEKIVVTKGILSIWRTNDDILDIFKEGSWIEVTNVVPTAYRNSEIHLSAGRQSLFRPLKRNEDDICQSYLVPFLRTCHLIQDLSQNPIKTADCNEIDTVGIIFSIEPSNNEFNVKNQFQNVYLADVEKNMIGVNFWGGIKKFGYENILQLGIVVYCGNLQKRVGNTRKNIPQYRATEFSIFTKTPRYKEALEIIEEITKKINGLDLKKFCEDCEAIKQNYSVIRSFAEQDNVTPHRFNKSDYNLAKNKMFIETPVTSKLKNKSEEFNLTGLDFESTFKQDTQELSPRTLARKKKVNEKISKLKMYGEPPPLSPVSIINKSKNATSSYKSPLVKNETVTSHDRSNIAIENKDDNVAISTKAPQEIINNDEVPRSPVISMNKTFVKRRSANPVKLNFSDTKAADQSADQFSGDFDGSPPLSLE